MSSPEDQLREAFQAHENLAPDAAAVYDRVQELSRSYKWRRRGITAAGGVVVGAGLIAGIVNLPAVLPGDPAAHPSAVAPAVQPSVTPPSLSAADINRAIEAYTAAGYDGADAARLAKLWHVTGDLYQVKIEAGRRLMDGQKLPIAAATADPAAARLEAFFNAGYGYDDAVKLQKLWKISDIDAVKAEAGKRLLAGEKLPVKPDPQNAVNARQDEQVAKFFAAGYDVDDAVTLSKLWHQKTPYEAKVEGGKRLLAGQSLPIKP